ncbi:myosin-2 heavy chain-like protein isoform X2 [Tasmannia lanceolata]
MRKIRLLQEVGGMNSSLGETLGDSNPHYSRIEREKIAAREAARKAMEARKAAMVEASWCRILRAARIPSKEAESQLVKAEKSVAEAFEEAAAMGVTMYDRPDCPRQPCEIETSPTTGGGSTHTVTASFETAFEVDKEVAAAVKTAFIQLAHCPTSLNKDEFRDLLRKISQNPDASETNQELSDLCSECESDAGSELESESNASFSYNDINASNIEIQQNKKGHHEKLVGIMLERLKRLKEDELSSLAAIVATCGLNAALLEVENGKQNGSDSNTDCTVGPAVTSQLKRKQGGTELPSLDKFLVKHVSRLEREVQEAKNTRKNDLLKERRKTMDGHISESKRADSNGIATLSEAVPNLGSILIKHTSRFEKEIQEAKKLQKTIEKDCERLGDMQERPQMCKENIDLNIPMQVEMDQITRRLPQHSSTVKHMSRIEKAKLEVLEAFSVRDGKGMKESCEDNGLDKILVKRVHRLEREKMQALALGKSDIISKDQKKQGIEVTASEALDKVLVKHVSNLEKEKMAALQTKNPSRLETKSHPAQQPVVDHIKHAETRQEAREREMREAWGGLSLGNSIRPHLSRLERDKAAWIRAEEEERRRSKGIDPI